MATPDPSDTGPLFQMIGAVAPVLVPYTQERIVEELWHRPGLSARDRAIVTVSVLVSRNAALAYPYYLNKALESGLTATELSELLTHLAFYAGWPYAFGAIAVARDVFALRGITPDQLPEISPALLSIDLAVPDEAVRAGFIAANVAPVSPALQHFTDELLYHEVWLRPGLAPRDRSLATVTALAASGQVAFLPFYLGRAIQHGLTRAEYGESLAHVAFYGGWGNGVQAAMTAKDVFPQ